MKYKVVKNLNTITFERCQRSKYVFIALLLSPLPAEAKGIMEK